MKFTEKTRNIIKERAGERCEMCGVRCEAGQIHHRQPRGMGGSKERESRSAANGLYLHERCHFKIERNRSDGYQKGWLVHKWETSEDKPVLMWDGWKILGADGSLTPVVSPTELTGE
jgi:5-methylcytosine-specific restriction enzyme A